MTHFTHLNQISRKDELFGQDYSHVSIFEETHEIWLWRDVVVEEVSREEEERVQSLSRRERERESSPGCYLSI